MEHMGTVRQAMRRRQANANTPYPRLPKQYTANRYANVQLGAMQPPANTGANTSNGTLRHIHVYRRNHWLVLRLHRCIYHDLSLCCIKILDLRLIVKAFCPILMSGAPLKIHVWALQMHSYDLRIVHTHLTGPQPRQCPQQGPFRSSYSLRRARLDNPLPNTLLYEEGAALQQCNQISIPRTQC